MTDNTPEETELGTLIREFLTVKYGREARCSVTCDERSNGLVTFDILASVTPAERPKAKEPQSALSFEE